MDSLINMNTPDDIRSLIEKNNPGASKESIDEVMSTLVPDFKLNTPSSFDIGVSDNTVTQNGATPSMPAPVPPTTLQPEPPEIPTEATPPATTPVAPPATPPTAPTALKTTPPPAPTKTEPTPDLMASSNDNEQRLAAEAEALRRRKMSNIPGAIAGIGDAIAAGASAFGVHAPTDKQEKLMERAKANFQESSHLFENRVKNDPNSDVSKAYRQMVLQIAPEMAKQPSFLKMSAQAIGDKLPLIDTMMKAQSAKDMKEMGMKQLESNKNISLGMKEDQQQDHLEQQAIQRMASLRGDQSLARIETQRDGAISAYTLLQQAKNEKRSLSQAEYYDVLGQLWKARTGASPTDAAIRDLDSKTFKGDINKASLYFTGKPAGATTQGVLDNLLQFTKHTGELTDAQHEAYMAPHLIKPTHLKDELWKPIKETARGMSFSDAVKNAAPKKQPVLAGSEGKALEDKKAALRQKLGL